MNQTSDLLEQEWSAALIVLSGGLAFMGAYSAVTLTELYRVSFKYKLKILSKNSILVLASIAVAGGAIWSMHFIAIVCAYIGLSISVGDTMFTMDGDEIVDRLVREMKGLHNIKDRNKVLLHMLLKGLVPLVVGGICTACGVCVMHYIGMLAMQADAMMMWNGGIVTVSCIIAIVAATVGAWILFRVLAIYPTYELLRCACALVIMVAVLAMHYTGMAAATYEYRPERGLNSYSTGPTISKVDAAYAAIIFNVMFNFIVQNLVLFEYRQLYYGLRSYEKQYMALTKIGRFLHEDFMANFNATYNKLKFSPPASAVAPERSDVIAQQILAEFNAIPASKSQVNPSDSYVSNHSNSSYHAVSEDVEDGNGSNNNKNGNKKASKKALKTTIGAPPTALPPARILEAQNESSISMSQDKK